MLTVDPRARTSDEPPRVLRSLPEAITAARWPLWGWRQGNGPVFVAARVPSNEPAAFTYQTIGQAVEIGVAAELRFGAYTLLQGPPALLKALLQQTPAVWTTAQEIRLMIDGIERTVWVMQSFAGARWLIVDLDSTLLILQDSGTRSTGALLEDFARLVPLQVQR